MLRHNIWIPTQTCHGHQSSMYSPFHSSQEENSFCILMSDDLREKTITMWSASDAHTNDFDDEEAMRYVSNKCQQVKKENEWGEQLEPELNETTKSNLVPTLMSDATHSEREYAGLLTQLIQYTQSSETCWNFSWNQHLSYIRRRVFRLIPVLCGEWRSTFHILYIL